MIRISAPATSANLGAAFDAAAIALHLRMHVFVDEAAPALTFEFGGSELPTHDGLEAKFREGMALVARDVDALQAHIRIENDIPLGVGLGSSAAALICGAAAAAHLIGESVSKEDLLRLAVEAEGHADNAAAAIYGGLCIVLREDVEMHVLQMPLLSQLRFAVVIPDATTDTRHSRALLPEEYPGDVVSHAIQRATMLGACLAAGRLDYLHLAMRDGVQQRHRALASPALAHALVELQPHEIAVVSGSGPSVLVVSHIDPDPLAARIMERFNRTQLTSRAVRVQPSAIGLTVETR